MIQCYSVEYCGEHHIITCGINIKLFKKMARKQTLTDEQRKLNRKNLDCHVVKLTVPKRTLDEFDDFSKDKKSRNLALLDLIKTNPKYIKYKENKKNQPSI